MHTPYTPITTPTLSLEKGLFWTNFHNPLCRQPMAQLTSTYSRSRNGHFIYLFILYPAYLVGSGPLQTSSIISFSCMRTRNSKFLFFIEDGIFSQYQGDIPCDSQNDFWTTSDCISEIGKVPLFLLQLSANMAFLRVSIFKKMFLSFVLFELGPNQNIVIGAYLCSCINKTLNMATLSGLPVIQV